MSEALERCYAAAMRILAYRFNSVAELRRKLAVKEFDAPTIDATIAKLTAEKWLDDERFAEAFVRTRGRKRIGTLRIRRELGAAGVDEEVAARAVARNSDPEAERAALHALAVKKLAMLRRRAIEDDVLRQKLSAYLARQGYEFSVVIDVVGEVLRRG
jgi:regulatory protein